MPNKPKEDVKSAGQRNFNSGYSVGLNLMSCVIVGMAIGYGIDYYFDTMPAFFLLFMFLGMAAGFRSIWYFMNAQNASKPSSSVGEADGHDPGQGEAGKSNSESSSNNADS